MRQIIIKRLIFFLIFFTCFTDAHQLSTAYLQAHINSAGELEGELQVRLYDLERELAIDADGNGELLWGELLAREADVNLYLNQHLQLLRNKKLCRLMLPTPWKIDSHYNEGYLVLPLRAQCPVKGDIEIIYQAFFNSDSQHKLLLSFTRDIPGTAVDTRVISAAQASVTLAADSGSPLSSFIEFTYQGIIHIWQGADHILFLCLLLLSCVLVRREKQWVGRETIREIMVHAAWIVTAFTLAHSLTLTATALDILHLPSRWVEVGIALSVVFAALNNIFPLVVRLGWLTFAFGLLHGMGFAGALGELGIPADRQLLAVLAFNFGVELGQMAIVLLVLPLLISVRNSACYARYGFTGLSSVIGMTAAYWVFQRMAI